MPWLILTCHWQVGTREFPAPFEAFNLQEEKTIKVLVLLGRREGPAATLQRWHIRFSITKKWQFCMWVYTNLRFPSCSSMLQHKFICTLPAQTLPGTSTLFLCLSVCLSFSIFQSHREFPFHFPHSIPSPLCKMLPPQPLDQWGLKVVYLQPATMLAKYPCTHFLQRTEPYFVSSVPEPKAVGNCSMLTTAIQLSGQSGKAIRGITSPRQVGHERPDLLTYVTVQLLLYI